MRGKIAWLKSPVRHRTLAPFGGITRIRFKGSSNWTSQPSRLPRLVELRLRPDPGKSTRQVGTVNVREVPGYRLELTPFGGIKDSGLGYKEGVLEAMKSFTNTKTYSLPW